MGHWALVLSDRRAVEGLKVKGSGSIKKGEESRGRNAR